MFFIGLSITKEVLRYMVILSGKAILLFSGPGCSKLTTSLVNVSVKFQSINQSIKSLLLSVHIKWQHEACVQNEIKQ